MDLEVGEGVLAAWGVLVSLEATCVLTVLTVNVNQVSEVFDLGGFVFSFCFLTEGCALD